jgi:hypothetical protein
MTKISKDRHDNEEGVHAAYASEGESERGHHVREKPRYNDNDKEHEFNAREAKHLSEENLNHLKMMPKPNLKGLAKGGEVKEELEEKAPESEKHEHQEHEDHELHQALGQELMSALESKDHKGVMDTVEAMILKCLSKMGEE